MFPYICIYRMIGTCIYTHIQKHYLCYTVLGYLYLYNYVMKKHKLYNMYIKYTYICVCLGIFSTDHLWYWWSLGKYIQCYRPSHPCQDQASSAKPLTVHVPPCRKNCQLAKKGKQPATLTLFSSKAWEKRHQNHKYICISFSKLVT